MKFSNFKKISIKETQNSRFFHILLFFGFLLVIFSLLRVYNWDPHDIKIVSGLGLIFLLLGLDFSIKSEFSFMGMLGGVISGISIFLYTVIGNLSIDGLALMFAAGLAIVITDIATFGFLDSIYKRIAGVTLDIKEEIREVVRPKFIEYSQSAKDLAEMATDIWRMEKKIAALRTNLQEPQVKAFENSVARLKRVLSKCEIEILDYSGQKYNEGLNVDILSVEKDPAVENPLIMEMVEPAVFFQGTIIKRGKVIIVENN